MHLNNIEQFLGLLVDGGTTVICMEHHQAVVAHSDYVIDIGPGTGHDGGTIIFAGTPAQLALATTLTAQHLAAYLPPTENERQNLPAS